MGGFESLFSLKECNSLPCSFFDELAPSHEIWERRERKKKRSERRRLLRTRDEGKRSWGVCDSERKKERKLDRKERKKGKKFTRGILLEKLGDWIRFYDWSSFFTAFKMSGGPTETANLLGALLSMDNAVRQQAEVTKGQRGRQIRKNNNRRKLVTLICIYYFSTSAKLREPGRGN